MAVQLNSHVVKAIKLLPQCSTWDITSGIKANLSPIVSPVAVAIHIASQGEDYGQRDKDIACLRGWIVTSRPTSVG
ncbi:hypothetical protein Acr_00g0006060 [Actinidia rufa]|uniref:Uncharacterized protein n=1 Tax=Actinidia rufa TaxID=165716 RepID=A0A7J0D7W9_9ERIC|nr:hypothetical protein Acr_00g0006060 [Actinidia rufa]